METFDRDTFLRLVSSREVPDEPFYVRIVSTLIPLKVHLPKDVRGIVFGFHGAIDRKTRELPAFAPIFRNLGATIAQVSVSDPSMLARQGFSMSWYAGHDGFDTQKELRDLFADIITVLNPERIYFSGSSGGGFASLYFSWHFPDSFAVVGVPQTRIESYYKGHQQRYRQGCWPEHENIPDHVTIDLCKLYGSAMSNNVIYIQSPGDYFHFKNQAVPFCAAVAKHAGERFLFDCRTWGRLGHSGAIPGKTVSDYLRAVMSSPLGGMDDVLMAFEHLQGAQPRLSKKEIAAIPTKYSAADLATASLLTRYQLSLAGAGKDSGSDAV